MMQGRNEVVLRFGLLFLVGCFIYPALFLKLIAHQSSSDSDTVSLSTANRTRAFAKNFKNSNESQLRLYELTKSPQNCIKSAIVEFPDDFMTQYTRLHQGGVIVHFLIAIYMFVGFVILCDDYFVPSLKKISVKLHMSSDVAGATFMAAGSSAPEFFTSVIGVFITNGDIGLGTIVGSAVYNVLFTIGICGLFAGSALVLSPWPLLRDSAGYLFSIAALIGVTYDKEVQWYEALMLVVMYLLYVGMMYFNSNLEKWFEFYVGTRTKDSSTVDEDSWLLIQASFETTQLSELSQVMKDTHKEGPNEVTLFSRPSSIISGILWILGLPLSCLFFVTIPDCRKEKWRGWYLVSFVMSVVWIALLSYVLVWMVAIIGYTLGIPDVIMSLTFLAAGSSLPDSISSVIVARHEDGDMAVSHTIGSNVFNILLCLGLPWLLQTTIVEPGGAIPVLSGSIIYTSISLAVTLFLTIISIGTNGWVVGRHLGAKFVVCYLAVISVATLFELNIFGNFNLPSC